jgi:hypothetical protein
VAGRDDQGLKERVCEARWVGYDNNYQCKACKILTVETVDKHNVMYTEKVEGGEKTGKTERQQVRGGEIWGEIRREEVLEARGGGGLGSCPVRTSGAEPCPEKTACTARRRTGTRRQDRAKNDAGLWRSLLFPYWVLFW